MADNWYDVVRSNELPNQGDILFNFPIVVNKLPNSYPDLIHLMDEQTEILRKHKETGDPLPPLKPIVESTIQFADVVILTQGCLIAGPSGPKVDQVTIAVINDVKGMKFSVVSEIMSAKRPPYHLLSKSMDPGILMNYHYVDFTDTYSVSYDLLKSFCENTSSRLRLKSPYVDELSQRFGLFYSKIGLPNNTIDKKDLEASL